METVTLQELQDEFYMEKNGVGAGENRTGQSVVSDSPSPVLWKHVKYQIVSSNVAFLYTIHAGVNLAFSNLLLNDLDRNASSWFASIGAVGIPIGATACGPLMDKVGRKTCNLIISVPCVGAWLILGFVNRQNIALLYLSRLLAGIAAGLTTSNLVYVSETSHKKYRSVFLSLLGVHFAFGILLTTLLKLVFTWRQSAVFFAVFFSIVALLVFKLTPESPIWLANFRSDWQAAKKSLLKLNNGNSKIFEQEWRNLKLNAAAGGIGTSTTKTKTTTTRKSNCGEGEGGGGGGGKYGWFEPTVYKPLSVLMILMLLQQLSGLYPTVYYAFDMFPKLGPKIGRLLKQEAFVLFGVVRFVASVLGCCVAGKVGRKPLLIFSSLGMLLALVVTVVASTSAFAFASATVTVTGTGNATANATATDDRLQFWGDFAEYAAVSGFILFVGVGAIGVMAVPWTLIVELLPTEKRAFGTAALISYAYLLLFGTAKIFPYALDSIGVAIMFAFFAAVSLLIAVFVHFFIPETLNRTLIEIESFYADASIGSACNKDARKDDDDGDGDSDSIDAVKK